MNRTKAQRIDDCPIHPDAVAHYGTEEKARENLKAATDAYGGIQRVRYRVCDDVESFAQFDRSQMGRCLPPLARDIDFILRGHREEQLP